MELQNGQLHALLHCDNVSGIRPETSELLTQLRAAYNEGALAKTSCAPTCPRPLHTRKEGRRAGGEGRARRAEGGGAGCGRRGGLARPRRPKPRQRRRFGAAAFGQRRLRRGGRASLEPFALDEPDFEVDYRLWLIEYADGSTRTFDSHAGTLA
ncbi:MAG: hypothetical protein ACLTMP_13205 [Eggerthella lenta]